MFVSPVGGRSSRLLDTAPTPDPLMALAIKAGECHPKQFAQAIVASGNSEQRLDFVSALRPSTAAGGGREILRPTEARAPLPW